MADDQLLDDDIDRELEPTPFISKALIGRFLAVGVFVALGTFAVIQSVTTKKPVIDEQLGLNPTTAASVKNAASSTTASVKNKVASVTSGFSTGNKNSIAPRPKPPAQLAKPLPRKPLVDPVVKKTPPSFGGSFGPNNLTAKTTPAPRPKPPERLAQNGGFLPTVGKQGLGAAKDTAAAALTKMQISKPLPGFNATADSAASTFRDLKKSVTSGGSSLATKASDAAKSTVSAGVNKVTEFGNAARKSLGSPLSNRLEERTSIWQSRNTSHQTHATTRHVWGWFRFKSRQITKYAPNVWLASAQASGRT